MPASPTVLKTTRAMERPRKTWELFTRSTTKKKVLNKEQMATAKRYSSPRLVVDWMEELIVGLLLVENAWCQKQSWSFMHLLCSGMVGFGLRRKLGTAGTERHSPPSSSSMAGGILVLSVGFVMFSTVVFLGDLEIYFLVPVSRQ